MFNKEFDDWFKSEMPNTYKGVGKEKLESFVYDTAMAAWQARVPEGYVVMPNEPTEEMYLSGVKERSSGGNTVDVYKAMLEAVEK
jgi:hypothetical protein